MSSEKLNSAIATIKAGDKVTGSRLLNELLQDEPSNENAWIWLAAIVDDIDVKKYYLKQALSLNPSKKVVIEALSQLEQPPHSEPGKILPYHLVEKESSPEKVLPNEDTPDISAILAKPVVASRKPRYYVIDIPDSKKRSAWIMIFILCICVLGLCTIGILSYKNGEEARYIQCESVGYIQEASIIENLQYSNLDYSLKNSQAVKDPNFTADDAYFVAAKIYNTVDKLDICTGVWYVVGSKDNPDNCFSVNNCAKQYSSWPSSDEPALLRYRLGDPNFKVTMNNAGANEALSCVK